MLLKKQKELNENSEQNVEISSDSVEIQENSSFVQIM